MSNRTPETNDGAYLRGRPFKPTVMLGQSAIWVVGIVVIVALGSTLFGERGLQHYLGLRTERDRLETEVGALTERYGQLISELDALADEPMALEKVAREQYRMHHPDETVIEVVEESSDDNN
jgi:cell division protein FtsB